MSASTMIDRDRWSGEGDFTEQLLSWLSEQSDVISLRVEDAPSTRTDVEYNFISNEIYVEFKVREFYQSRRVLGVIPLGRKSLEKTMSLEKLNRVLSEESELGEPDYADEGMIQFLHTERIIPPYQTKGYKLIELVRIYEFNTTSRRS
jgi:hypothetical protein|tara:strand:- start:112 stop:555 length:444 start_codon:yes stop_codon:yes gene_type:complete